METRFCHVRDSAVSGQKTLLVALVSGYSGTGFIGYGHSAGSRRVTKSSGESQTENDRDLIDRVIDGDHDALAQLFSQNRDRLWRMISFRLDPRLHGRVDADDILQEAWLAAVQRIEYFLSDATRSIFVWFRLIVSQTLIDLHRRHLGTQKRNAALEFSINRGGRRLPHF